jgi:uncharacterized membrane protein
MQNKIPTAFLLLPIVALLLVAGVAHLFAPDLFLRIMPDWTPWKYFWVIVSGIAELLLGVGLLLPRWRILAGWLTIAMLAVYIPVHVLDLLRDQPVVGSKLIATVRLPIQLLLMGWVYALLLRFRVGRGWR